MKDEYGNEYELIGGPKQVYKKRRYIKKPRPLGHQTTPKPATTIAWHAQLVADLRATRLRQGVTQAQLGHSLGTNQAAICKFELGQTNPSLKFISSVTIALNQKITVTLL